MVPPKELSKRALQKSSPKEPYELSKLSAQSLKGGSHLSSPKALHFYLFIPSCLSNTYLSICHFNVFLHHCTMVFISPVSFQYQRITNL